MRPLTSRIKVALLSAGLSGLVLVGFGFFAWGLFYQSRLAATDREIRGLAARHPGLYSGRGGFERLESSLEFTFGQDYTNRVIVLLTDADGGVLHKSPHWPANLAMQTPGVRAKIGDLKPTSSESPATNSETETANFGKGGGWGRGGFGRGGPPPAPVFSGEPEFFTIRAGGSDWRAGRFTSDTVELVLGIGLTGVRQEMTRVRNAFLATVPPALLLIGLGGWVIAGRALRPLNTIAATAEAVTAQGMDRRIPETAESPETQRVITVLNRMMDRLEASFHQATRFSADASHELKTPLAIMQGDLELALQAAPPASPEQRLCNSLLEGIQRLKTITRSLLLLAQADGGRLQLATEEVNLSADVEALIEDATALAPEKMLIFETVVPPGVSCRGDRSLLRMAVFNLLSNAVKYSEPGGRLSLELSSSDAEIALLVGNSGEEIPSDEQRKIFNRFHRVTSHANTQTEGLGLGLSLAREIARAHHGEVRLIESRAGWTSFLLSLPSPKKGRAG
jgi:signal transduction histidine kinase